MELLIHYDLMGCKCLTGPTSGENDHPMWLLDLMTVFWKDAAGFSRVFLNAHEKKNARLEVMTRKKKLILGLYVKFFILKKSDHTFPTKSRCKGV